MRYALCLIALVSLVFAPTALNAATITGPMFGFNYEWLRDADGDGIPNHLDPDYVPPQDGTGYKMMWGKVTPVALTSVFLTGNDQPAATGDRTHDRIRLNDGIRDRIQLRLKDGSCE